MRVNPNPELPMSLFAIAGVTGNTGRVVADLLLAQGHQVRVIVRDEAKAAPWRARGAQVALADVSDEAALTEALRGVDGAWLLLPPNMATGDFRAWQGRVGTILVRAVRAAAPKHVVLLSSIGAHLESGTGPIAGLHPVEQGLADLPSTGVSFVRAAYFMENLLGSMGMLDQGVFPTFTGKDLAIPMIATRDIGEVGAGLLLEGPPAPGAPRIVELGGPPVSPADVADVLSDITGRTITVAEYPVQAMAGALTGMGFPADMAALYQEMSEAMVDGRLRFEGGHRHAPGRTGIGSFLRGALSQGA